jgi:hypothetical protein
MPDPEPTTADELLPALPGAAQVAVAIELIRHALPIWEAHVREHPDQLEEVSALIDDGHRVRGGGTVICAGFPREIVDRVAQALADGTDLQCDPILRCYLATLMGPLTHAGWEEVLSPGARLLYTAVYNLVVALVFRRTTPDDELHVAVAVDHACDAAVLAGLATPAELLDLARRAAATTPMHARDPLVADTNPALELPNDGYSGFLAAIRREHVRCPRCTSTRVVETDVGIEFTQVQCQACGNETMADVWQLDEWYV